jgi:hypothetical protein
MWGRSEYVVLTIRSQIGQQKAGRHLASGFVFTRFEMRLFAGLVQTAHTTGADLETELDAVDGQAFLLHVRRESTIGVSLREADIVSERLGFAANFTLPGHERTPLTTFSASRRVASFSDARQVSPDTYGLKRSIGINRNRRQPGKANLPLQRAAGQRSQIVPEMDTSRLCAANTSGG